MAGTTQNVRCIRLRTPSPLSERVVVVRNNSPLHRQHLGRRVSLAHSAPAISATTYVPAASRSITPPPRPQAWQHSVVPTRTPPNRTPPRTAFAAFSSFQSPSPAPVLSQSAVAARSANTSAVVGASVGSATTAFASTRVVPAPSVSKQSSLAIILPPPNQRHVVGKRLGGDERRANGKDASNDECSLQRAMVARVLPPPRSMPKVAASASTDGANTAAYVGRASLNQATCGRPNDVASEDIDASVMVSLQTHCAPVEPPLPRWIHTSPSFRLSSKLQNEISCRSSRHNPKPVPDAACPPRLGGAACEDFRNDNGDVAKLGTSSSSSSRGRSAPVEPTAQPTLTRLSSRNSPPASPSSPPHHLGGCLSSAMLIDPSLPIELKKRHQRQNGQAQPLARQTKCRLESQIPGQPCVPTLPPQLPRNGTASPESHGSATGVQCDRPAVDAETQTDAGKAEATFSSPKVTPKSFYAELKSIPRVNVAISPRVEVALPQKTASPRRCPIVPPLQLAPMASASLASLSNTPPRAVAQAISPSERMRSMPSMVQDISSMKLESTFNSSLTSNIDWSPDPAVAAIVRRNETSHELGDELESSSTGEGTVVDNRNCPQEIRELHSVAETELDWELSRSFSVHETHLSYDASACGSYVLEQAARNADLHAMRQYVVGGRRAPNAQMGGCGAESGDARRNLDVIQDVDTAFLNCSMRTPRSSTGGFTERMNKICGLHSSSVTRCADALGSQKSDDVGAVFLHRAAETSKLVDVGAGCVSSLSERESTPSRHSDCRDFALQPDAPALESSCAMEAPSNQSYLSEEGQSMLRAMAMPPETLAAAITSANAAAYAAAEIHLSSVTLAETSKDLRVLLPAWIPSSSVVMSDASLSTARTSYADVARVVTASELEGAIDAVGTSAEHLNISWPCLAAPPLTSSTMEPVDVNAVQAYCSPNDNSKARMLRDTTSITPESIARVEKTPSVSASERATVTKFSAAPRVIVRTQAEPRSSQASPTKVSPTPSDLVCSAGSIPTVESSGEKASDSPPLHALRQRASALSDRLLQREQQCIALKRALEGCGLAMPGNVGALGEGESNVGLNDSCVSPRRPLAPCENTRHADVRQSS